VRVPVLVHELVGVADLLEAEGLRQTGVDLARDQCRTLFVCVKALQLIDPANEKL
jgi:hypothetical protein